MPHRQMLRQIRVQLESKGHGSVQSHPDKNDRKQFFQIVMYLFIVICADALGNNCRNCQRDRHSRKNLEQRNRIGNCICRNCTTLRSMTGGRGSYSYEFARYEQAPADVQEKEIEKRAAEE